MQNIPTQNNNPGNIKDPATGQFKVFSSPEEGFSALTDDLQHKISGATSTGLTGDSTLSDFSNVWAPASDKNDPKQYAQNLASQLGVDTNTPIKALGSRIGDFASAIAKNEGYQGMNPFQAQTAQAAEIPQSGQSQGQQLSHDQLLANINAMETQGAKPQEIQSYLDSLKGNSYNPKPYSNPTPGSPLANQGQGNEGNQYTGTLGTNPNDDTYGKIIDNSVTRGIKGFANAMTGGGAGELGNAIGGNGTVGSGALGALKTGASIGGLLAAPGLLQSAAGLVGLGGKAAALSAPEIAYNIPMEMSEFSALGDTEKLNVLGEALKSAPTGDAIKIAEAIKALNPTPGFLSSLIKTGTNLAVLEGLKSVFGPTVGGVIHKATGL